MYDKKYYEEFMEIAIEEAKASLKEGNKGFGAIIIKDNKIIVQTHDTEVTDNDPTAHAEMNALKKAAKILGKELEECILISTHEPCPMCMTAIIWSRISQLIYGASIEDSLKQGRNVINISSHEIKSRSNAKIQIIQGILKEKCAKLYNSEIREMIKLLRTPALDKWKLYSKELLEKRRKWFDDNKSQIDKLPGNDIEKAFNLLKMKLEIDEREIPIIQKTSNKLVFHSKNFCPTLEACKILDLDTRVICKEILEDPTEKFIQLINPKLQFTRNYNSLRPYTDYCEEIIFLRE